MPHKIYKNFLIEQRSVTRENTYYDGHRNEGNGTYSTSYLVQVTDMTDGKYGLFDTETKALAWIDGLDSATQEPMSQKIKELELTIQTEEKLIDDLKASIRHTTARINLASAELAKLKRNTKELLY